MQAAYGTWQSPITPELIVGGSIGLSAPVWHGDAIFWVESRPTEGGRNVLVRRTGDGTIQDINPAPYNIRTRVHEYGGGAYVVTDGVIVFSEFDHNRLLLKGSPDESPTELVTDPAIIRQFALEMKVRQYVCYDVICVHV